MVLLVPSMSVMPASRRRMVYRLKTLSRRSSGQTWHIQHDGCHRNQGRQHGHPGPGFLCGKKPRVNSAFSPLLSYYLTLDELSPTYLKDHRKTLPLHGKGYMQKERKTRENHTSRALCGSLNTPGKSWTIFNFVTVETLQLHLKFQNASAAFTVHLRYTSAEKFVFMKTRVIKWGRKKMMQA